MKRLNSPGVADVSNLRLLSRNQLLRSYPALANNIKGILRSYCAYREVKGNAADPGSPEVLQLDGQLETALRSHYSSPPGQIAPFIFDLRKKGSPDVCPMCGCPKSGTLDHFFPKDLYAEFSIFSLNLVPCCDCNTKRGLALLGAGANERILHPYFDDILTNRLVTAHIEPSEEHGYERPTISLQILVNPATPEFEAVNFHVTSVLLRTDILYTFDVNWPKLVIQPEDYFTLPDGPISDELFRQGVIEALEKRDRHFGTPNNWDSMLFAGIESNPAVITFLNQRVASSRT